MNTWTMAKGAAGGYCQDMKNCYDWIAEDIRWLEAIKWRTNDEEHQLKGLYELKEALQKLDKKKGA